MLQYIKAFLVLLGFLNKTVSEIEIELEKEKILAAEKQALETKDTSALEDLASR